VQQQRQQDDAEKEQQGDDLAGQQLGALPVYGADQGAKVFKRVQGSPPGSCGRWR